MTRWTIYDRIKDVYITQVAPTRADAEEQSRRYIIRYMHGEAITHFRETDTDETIISNRSNA
jgi:hypothetical protein